MHSVRVSATHARNNFFDLLNQVAEGKEFIIEKDKKEVAVISRKKKPNTDIEGLRKLMSELHGMDKDFDLSKSPLRGKKSREWLKKIRNY